MTPGQTALADGFRELLASHGQTWTRTGDSASITGVVTRVKSETPHIPNGPDRDETILVADASLSSVIPAASVMPATRLKKGDELTKGTRKFRVVRADYQESNGLWLVILSPTF